jgi:hypothetical protein
LTIFPVELERGDSKFVTAVIDLVRYDHWKCKKKVLPEVGLESGRRARAREEAS